MYEKTNDASLVEEWLAHVTEKKIRFPTTIKDSFITDLCHHDALMTSSRSNITTMAYFFSVPSELVLGHLCCFFPSIPKTTLIKNVFIFSILDEELFSKKDIELFQPNILVYV